MALTEKQLRELRRCPVGATGNKVAKAIDLEGITQAVLAEAAGLTQPYVSDVARGRYPTITVENAHSFALHFGCSIEDLFPARQAVAS